MTNDTPQSLGGKARAQSLSPVARSEIARRAALARYARSDDPLALPNAGSQGTLTIGDVVIDVYVLQDRRQLTPKPGMAPRLGLRSVCGNALMNTTSTQ